MDPRARGAHVTATFDFARGVLAGRQQTLPDVAEARAQANAARTAAAREHELNLALTDRLAAARREIEALEATIRQLVPRTFDSREDVDA
jgi:gamma-glutamyl phosphate reductase